MARFVKPRSKSKGLPPGSLVYMADHRYENVKMTVLDFTADTLTEKVVQDVQECLPQAHSPGTVTWVDIEGLSDPKVIAAIGQMFGIDPLWLEDVMDTDHRPKMEELHDQLFILLKNVERSSSHGNKIFFEQISLILGKNFIISFQEYPGDVLTQVKNRLRAGKGKLRQSGADYLFYSLVDAVVDNYFGVLESLGSDIEDLDDKLSSERSPRIASEINQLKSEILYLWKSSVPLRESIGQICRSKRPDIDKLTYLYFKDAHEHTIQIVEVIDSYREMLSSLLDVHRSNVAQKTNEIMKVLTMFSSIFIPLTFIVSIYGMNFEFMPELHWRWGYEMVWLLLGLSGTGMFLFFKRKKWL